MSHSHSHSSHNELPTGVTEPDAVNVRSIIGYAVGLTVVTVISQIAMWLMFGSMASNAEASAPPPVYPLADDPDTQRPAEPRLQIGVSSDHGQLLQRPRAGLPGRPRSAQCPQRLKKRPRSGTTLGRPQREDRSHPDRRRDETHAATRLPGARGSRAAAAEAATATPEAAKEAR